MNNKILTISKNVHSSFNLTWMSFSIQLFLIKRSFKVMLHCLKQNMYCNLSQLITGLQIPADKCKIPTVNTKTLTL
jgi:hypothetical protein